MLISEGGGGGGGGQNLYFVLKMLNILSDPLATNPQRVGGGGTSRCGAKMACTIGTCTWMNTLKKQHGTLSLMVSGYKLLVQVCMYICVYPLPGLCDQITNPYHM